MSEEIPFTETPAQQRPLPPKEAIDTPAREIARSRGYPKEMAGLYVGS